MKKCMTILFLLCFHFLYAGSTYFVKLPSPAKTDHNRISIEVVPQVELISIVQTISAYPSILGFLMSADSSEYKTSVINHFSNFSNHPAVKMFDRLSSKPAMLNFSAPSNIMLYTTDELELRKDIQPDEFVLNRAGGADSLILFLDLLKDFATKSSFAEFFNNNLDYYQEIINKTIKNTGKTNYINELEDFYGFRQKSYNIVLVSLYGSVGFGNSLLFPCGQREIYCTLGPQKTNENIPFFGDEVYLKYLIRHEFSHPFINPLTEKHWDLVSSYSENYDSIPENARKNMCGDWQECINEFTIRAITTHLSIAESEEAGIRAYQREESRGVIYLNQLLDAIDLYQADRKNYPTMVAYYPELLRVFMIK